MTRIITLALAVGLVAPAMAQTTAQTEALIAAIAASGCEVREGNNAAILAAANLTQDEASTIVAALLADGRAAVEGGTLRLKTAGCN
ncbi:MAG: hypothetical protein ACK4OP_13245 [Gemmobacter sp.]